MIGDEREVLKLADELAGHKNSCHVQKLVLDAARDAPESGKKMNETYNECHGRMLKMIHGDDHH